MKNTINFIFFLLCSIAVSAQSGTLRGSIIDDATGEPIMFANVYVVQTQSGTTSDLDGLFELELPIGTYDLKFSYVGYNELPVQGIVIKPGAVEVVTIRMKEYSEMIEQVIVTATQLRNTETALATIKRKSYNLVDGMSSQTFKKTGDGDAGEALKRVTGVSVNDGKHVVVRGLGDRYTKTILNGVEIPGLDPDKNSVEMNLFPTNLIDNILVYKSFTPNLPGDFTGGAVDIVTKDFPESKTFSVSVSAGYRPNMHFTNDFLTYDGARTDALGFDDGTRALPFDKNASIPDISLKNPASTAFTRSFDSQLGAVQKTNDLDKSISISGGNQHQLKKGKFGYIYGLNYGHSYTHLDDIQFNEYYQNVNNPNFFLSRASSGTVSTENVRWSALGGVSYKVQNHKIGLQLFRVQDADKIAGKLTQSDLEFNDSRIQRDNLEYYQREITNLSVNGEHVLNESGKLRLDWKISPSMVKLSEPDIRTTGFDITEPDEVPVIFPSIGADITRTWRNLDETNMNGRLDLTYEFALPKGQMAKFKTGFYATLKERDFSILNYVHRVNNQLDLNFNGDANNILLDQNIWTPESHPKGVYTIGNFQPANTFNARQNVMAGYVMSEMPLSKKIRATFGVRIEQAQNFYTGTNNQGTVSYDDDKVMDAFNVLPSLNLIYEVADRTNLRLSANRTIARPTFKEASIAQIQDRISGRTFLGNIDIEQSKINNFDLRIERFLNGSDLISASLFFKQFYNPIQLVVFSANTPDNYQPQNLDDTEVYGFEVEIVKELDFLSQNLNGLAISTNYTYVKSTMDLIGLSPSIFNTGLTYGNQEAGINASLVYNVQGRSLSIVGIQRIADVYDVPFKSLNFNLSKSFGTEGQYAYGLQVENILNSVRQRDYQTNNEQLAIFDGFTPGRKFTVSFSYTMK